MIAGHTDSAFAAVADIFASVIDGHDGTGAAFACWVDGRLVVDLWGGAADAARTQPWHRDSIAQPYSVTKPIAATCALHLVDAGALDLDAPVQRYWPEFTAAATVRHVLSHQAGVVVLDAPAPTELFYDWDALCSRLAQQEPLWEPGTALGESALFYGHLVGELVRRVSGQSLGCYLREEICGPLGLDFSIGLTPEEQARTVQLTGLGPGFEEALLAGRPALFRTAMTNPPGALDPAVVNGVAWRQAEVPAINGHGTARALAGFYAELLRGRVLSRSLLGEATTIQARGRDRVFGTDNAFGLGFGVDDDGFGMGGVGGSFAAACNDGYTVAYVTGLLAPDSGSGLALENSFRSCLGLAALA